MKEARQDENRGLQGRTSGTANAADSPPAKILAAAEDVFAEMGYKAATTREIARRADVNIAAIHYYWGKKSELWYAVVQHMMARLTELSRALLAIPGKDLEKGLRAVVKGFVDIFADNPNYARLLSHRTMEGVSLESAKELSLPILNVGMAFLKARGRAGAGEIDPAMILFGIQGALRIFFQERESVKTIFGEDPFRLSSEFRQKLTDFISRIALGLIGAESGPRP